MTNCNSYNAWVTYLDIWGFSHEVERTPPTEIYDRLSNMVTKYSNRLAADPSILPETFFFSDSLFLVFDVSRCGGRLQAFEACRDRTQEMIQTYLDAKFLTRGAIAYGEVAVGKGILLGPPVVRAAKWEQALTAPIVILPMAEIERCFKEAPPLAASNLSIVSTSNGGLVRAYLVHATHISDQIQAVKIRMEECLDKGPELGAARLQLALELLRKCNNHD